MLISQILRYFTQIKYLSTLSFYRLAKYLLVKAALSKSPLYFRAKNDEKKYITVVFNYTKKHVQQITFIFGLQ